MASFRVVEKSVPKRHALEKATGLAKSIGQPTTIMPPPAIANAISEALGIRVRKLPITGEMILEELGKVKVKEKEK